MRENYRCVSCDEVFLSEQLISDELFCPVCGDRLEAGEFQIKPTPDPIESRSSQHRQSHEHKVDEKISFILRKCPFCKKDVRIPLPPPNGVGTCKGCFGRFRILTDHSGDIHLNSEGKEHAQSGIQAYLGVLGMNNKANPHEIRAAYRKAISGYHPDKTAHLGEELQQLAEKKTREIMEAYEKLKALGYAE